ncbi:MAG TPA: hypothetical protein VIV14_04175 [Gammaproteobacteria bacterium]
MSDKKAAPSGGKQLVPIAEGARSEDSDDDIETLRRTVARYRKALELIRDQTFEPANSPRIIDQLWHFVRWSKSTARNALEDAGENPDR